MVDISVAIPKEGAGINSQFSANLEQSNATLVGETPNRTLENTKETDSFAINSIDASETRYNARQDFLKARQETNLTQDGVKTSEYKTKTTGDSGNSGQEINQEKGLDFIKTIFAAMDYWANIQSFRYACEAKILEQFKGRQITMAGYAGNMAGYEMRTGLAGCEQHLAGVYGVNLQPSEKPYDFQAMLGTGELEYADSKGEVHSGKNAFAYFDEGGTFSQIANGNLLSCIFAGFIPYNFYNWTFHPEYHAVSGPGASEPRN